MAVHNRATEIREERRLTITQVAAALGTSRQTIYDIERREGYRVSLDLMVRLAELLGVTMDELLGAKQVA